MKRVELDKLITFADYAKREKITLDAVYKRANSEAVNVITIGGRKFIYEK